MDTVRAEIARREALLDRPDFIARLPDGGECIRVAIAKLRSELEIIAPPTDDVPSVTPQAEGDGTEAVRRTPDPREAAERVFHLEQYGDCALDPLAVIASCPSWALLSEESRRAKLAATTATVLTARQSLQRLDDDDDLIAWK